MDPDSNVLEVYRLQTDANAPERTLTSKETLTTALLPGFSLDLAWVFAE